MMIALVTVLTLTGSPPTAEAQTPQRPPAPVVCAMKDRAAVKKYEEGVAANPGSVPALIALAQCHDTAWRFADAERVIREILATVRHLAAEGSPTPSSADAIPTAGGSVQVPRVTTPTYLEYPSGAADRGITGTVAVEARLDKRGTVRQTRVVEADRWLESAARAAIGRLRFEPPLVNGQPADVNLIYFAEFGRPREIMPADWLDRARIFLSLGLTEQAVPQIEAALARVERDRARLGDSGEFGDEPYDGPKPTPPTKIRHTAPHYPEIAQVRRIDGVVVIQAMVDKYGDVGRARVTTSVPMLDAAALDAVMAWGYTPVKVDDVARTFIVTVTVTFSLR
jgi:TonB family protein